MDDLERRIRVARPLSGHRDLPLSDRAKRELAELVLTGTPRTPSHKQTRLRRRTALVVAALAFTAIILAGAVTVSSLLRPGPAYAATPSILKVSPLRESAHDLLTSIGDIVDMDQPSSQPQDFTIRVQAWTLHVNDDGKATSSVIVPENYEITKTSDGSRRERVTSAGPQASDGSPAQGGAGPVAGHVLWKESWGPGKYQPVFPQPAPVDAARYSAYFGAVTGTRVSAAAAIHEVNDLLLEQQLTSQQEAALLEYFASLPDLRTAGEVTDRLGRRGIEFIAKDPDRPEYESYLIVSPKTGHIIATETIYTGHTRTDIASPSVVNYYAWK